MKKQKPAVWIGSSLLVAALVLLPKFVNAQQQHQKSLHVVVIHDVIHVLSPKLGGMKPVPPAKGVRREIPLLKPMPSTSTVQPTTTDPVLQTALGPTGATDPWINFLGVGNNQPNFTPCCAPPDTNGAAGATQYVQWVNTEFAVFSKSTGQIQYGPVSGNTLWQPLGGSCAANNSGDIIAQYDKQAQRWVMMQPVFSSPYQLCVAVSTSSDAIGTYNLYDFSIPSNYFPDYPKLAVWPDAYYMSYNAFTSPTGAYISGYACALDRSAMLQGSAATMQCVETGYPSLLPSDLDGDSGAPGTTAAPPAGSPDYYLDFTTSSALNLFAFHVDWTNPANSTWSTNPTVLPVASFTEACGGGTCIPQPGTSQQLASLGDRLMYRLAYRNFGSYQSMVVSQSVDTGNGNTGVRWYEIRNPGTNPTVYQQGTFAPDSNDRWMPSIAEDKLGDIALGYSVSGSATYPSIRVTGRVPGDPLGTMEAESSLLAGAASQTSGLARWGDYSSMSVDPTNDCTFWYTNEYQPSNGAFNWSTQVGSFSFPGCAAAPPTDFSLTGAPTTRTVTPGSATSYLLGVDPVGGYTGNVTLSLASSNTLPTGMSVSFSSTTVDVSGASSVGTTMTVSTTAATPGGTYQVTVSGTDGTNTNSVTVPIVVQAPNFSLSVSPATQTLSGTYADYTVNVTPGDGYTGSVTLSLASSLPSGVTASFYTNPVVVSGPSGGTSTLEFLLNASASAGTYNLTVSGTDGTLTHTTQLTLTIPQADFSLSSLGSQSVAAGNSATYTFYLNSADYYSGSVNVSLTSPSSLPTGMTASFSPITVNVQPTQENFSTLTVNTTASTPQGTYNLTVTASDGTNTHTTTGTIVVQAPPAADFSIVSNTGSAGLVAGNNLTDTIQVTPSYGYTGNVSLSITSPSSLPAGMTATFSPQTVDVTGTSTVDSTLTIATSTTTAPGGYSLTITGTDGTITHTASLYISLIAPSDFSLAGSPTTQTVTQGNSAGYTISVVPSGSFTGAVSLTTSSLPTGVTAAFNPASVSTSSGTATSALTISTSSSTAVGTFSFSVIGTYGSTTHSIPLSLTVQSATSSDFTISATPSIAAATSGSSASYTVTVAGSSGSPFSGTVNLGVSGVPPRTSSNFSTTSITGSGTAILSVSPHHNAKNGTYTLTITGTSGSLSHSVTVTFVVGTLSTPDFSLSALPASQTVSPGGSTSYSVAVSSLNSFTGTVDLNLGTLPSGVSASVSPTSVSGSGNATLSVSTQATAAPGTYTLTVSGVSGSLSHTAQVTLVIQNPSSGGDFSIAISPSSQSVGAKSSVSYTVTVSALNGFTGTVSLSVSGLPKRTSASLSTTTITGSGTATLTISTTPKSPVGSYTVTVTGSSGSLTHAASAGLNIT